MKEYLIGITIVDDKREAIFHYITGESYKDSVTLYTHCETSEVDDHGEPVVVVNIVTKPDNKCDILYRKYRKVDLRSDTIYLLDDAANIAAYDYTITKIKN